MTKHPVLENLRFDFPAGFVVFLVALPLCLGLALASNAPLLSGLVTGVIGGIVVGLLSGSELSVSGPGNGLTVIVLAGIAAAGDFSKFLPAVMLAGIFQLTLGWLRAGAIANFFPNAVIEGMLAAIGITIVIKQIPHAIGGAGHFESDMQFWHFLPQDNTLTEILHSIAGSSPSAIVISVMSLVILALWDRPWIRRHPTLQILPGALVTVIAGVFVNLLFHWSFPSLALHAADGHLVQIPSISGIQSLLNELHFPDFSSLKNIGTWTLGFTIAGVASVETLLSIESTDKVDPQRRRSDPNRELFAQGVGNFLCGLIGGLPMTSVIVRSSANIYAGARTRLASVVHGFFLLAAVLVLSQLLNHIPLASLAAVLISVGLKLCNKKIFIKAYRDGLDQFLPFVVTILAILFTNLLTGVLIGVIVGVGFVVKASYYSAITAVGEGKDFLIRFNKDVTFVHKVKLRNELAAIPAGAKVLIDGTRAMFLDHDILEMIHDFQESARARSIKVEVKALDGKRFNFLTRKG